MPVLFFIPSFRRKPESRCRHLLIHCICLALLACAHDAEAQRAGDIPDYDFTWATIGDLGNVAFEGATVFETFKGRGSVDYTYRMSTKELTVSQWFEFVNVYAPYAFRPTSSSFTSDFIAPVTEQDGSLGFRIIPGWENAPTQVSWRMAARYVNWLHNGKATNREAFENGVYDTSTFVTRFDEDGNPHGVMDQATHHPDARFWIPTLDEFIKAAYYDPNKDGEGNPGWWRFPTTSDVAPIADSVEEGGETNAGLRPGPVSQDGFIPIVGEYVDVTSPWGLFDLSGGLSELTEEWFFEGFNRVTFGSDFRTFFSTRDDLLGSPGSASPSSNPLTTIHIASAIPAPDPDLNGDGVVSVADLAILLASRGVCPDATQSCQADLNGDGFINGADVAILARELGRGPK